MVHAIEPVKTKKRKADTESTTLWPATISAPIPPRLTSESSKLPSINYRIVGFRNRRREDPSKSTSLPVFLCYSQLTSLGSDPNYNYFIPLEETMTTEASDKASRAAKRRAERRALHNQSSDEEEEGELVLKPVGIKTQAEGDGVRIRTEKRDDKPREQGVWWI